MAENKTFTITVGGEALPVPCMPRLGHAREIWRAIEQHGKPTSMSEATAYQIAYIAAATGKAEAIVEKNCTPTEAMEAVKTLDREWLESGFFVKIEPPKTENQPNPDTGDSSTPSGSDTAGASQT